MIAALAFVPPDEVKAYFEQYCDYAQNLYNDDCDPIIILRIPTLVGFVETHLEGHLFLHRHYGTCFIELLMELREQITT